MRRLIWLVLLLLAALPVAAAAQEFRGNISGTVRDSGGVVPGASVRVRNVDTNVNQNLVTNASGYFEAPLLNPGTYEVTVEMNGYRKATRANVVLGVGQQATVPFTLEVGAISEEIVVRGEAPLLDTNSVSSGANFDTHLVEALPMFLNMPITLARFAPGVNVNDQQTQVSQGYVDNTSLSAGSLLGLPLAGTQNPNTPPVGGNNYTLDGANNHGSNRRIAASPNSDMIQEMRVESSNFDASVGHGLGLQISMMTRAGANQPRGTANYQYWTNKLNSLTEQQKLTFDDRAKSEFEKGRSHNLSLTHGGPVVIPGLVNGRGKLFYFANYSMSNDDPGKNSGSDHRSGESETHAGGLFRSAQAAEPGAVPDLRPADHAPRSDEPVTDDPRSISRQHHSARSHPQPGRQLQEPADGPVLEDGAEAESAVRREPAAAHRQLLPGRPAGLTQEPAIRFP